jgi:hypothetical protein
MPASDPPTFLRWLGGQLPGNQSFWVPGEVWLQSWNLKELTEGHHQEWSLRLNLTQHGKPHQARTPEGLTDWELFLDSVGGGAWPFLVGGAICLVNSDNERDSSLLNRRTFRHLKVPTAGYPVHFRSRGRGPAARSFVVLTVGVHIILLRGTGGF